jgi:drug/metabolite transporter (DMT)-like permease
MGLFPTAIAFLTWSYALSRTSAGRLATSSYVVPALAVLLSWLLLGEVPVPLAFVGGALCLAGVAVTRLPARPKSTKDEAGTDRRQVGDHGGQQQHTEVAAAGEAP